MTSTNDFNNGVDMNYRENVNLSTIAWLREVCNSLSLEIKSKMRRKIDSIWVGRRIVSCDDVLITKVTSYCPNLGTTRCNTLTFIDGRLCLQLHCSISACVMPSISLHPVVVYVNAHWKKTTFVVASFELFARLGFAFNLRAQSFHILPSKSFMLRNWDCEILRA